MAPFARLESSDLFLNSIGILLADLIASIMARDSLLEPFKSEITLGRGRLWFVKYQIQLLS